MQTMSDKSNMPRTIAEAESMGWTRATTCVYANVGHFCVCGWTGNGWLELGYRVRERGVPVDVLLPDGLGTFGTDVQAVEFAMDDVLDHHGKPGAHTPFFRKSTITAMAHELRLAMQRGES